MAQTEPTISQGHCYRFNQDSASSLRDAIRMVKPCLVYFVTLTLQVGVTGPVGASQAGGDQAANSSPQTE